MIEYFNYFFKVLLNRIGNYIAKSFSNSEGCLSCKANTITLSGNVCYSFYLKLNSLLLDGS